MPAICFEFEDENSSCSPGRQWCLPHLSAVKNSGIFFFKKSRTNNGLRLITALRRLSTECKMEGCRPATKPRRTRTYIFSKEFQVNMRSPEDSRHLCKWGQENFCMTFVGTVGRRPILINKQLPTHCFHACTPKVPHTKDNKTRPYADG